MRRGRGVLAVLAAAAAAAAMCGCESVAYDCDYRIATLIQREEGGEESSVGGIVAYGFYADTLRWRVAGYEDALQGVLTDRSTGATRTADVTGEYDESGESVSLRFTDTPAFIVVCDPQERLYGWKVTDIGENLPVIYTEICFRPWRQSAGYTDLGWNMVNEFFVPDAEPELPDAEDGLPDTSRSGRQAPGVHGMNLRADAPQASGTER